MSTSVVCVRKNIERTATHCNTLQHTATHCNTLQHTATPCSSLQLTATQFGVGSKDHGVHCNTLQRAETHCNTLQHTATHCNTVWRVVEEVSSALQHAEIHCNTLQHTATHCNSLQLTATQFGVWSKKYRVLIRLGRLPSKEIEKPLDGTYSSPQQTATHCNLLQHSQRWFVWAPLKNWKALGWYVIWKTNNLRLTKKYPARTRHLGGLLCENSRKLRESTYSSLQHTATHCNSLQLTATHCNKKGADLSA